MQPICTNFGRMIWEQKNCWAFVSHMQKLAASERKTTPRKRENRSQMKNMIYIIIFCDRKKNICLFFALCYFSCWIAVLPFP